ncbi:elongation of very long chain fatty acids protein AAEL008004-like [Nylanderia fulva]|uniref:elongation of very long chain fatty acids protein AAEL008004-like n=1 Tax=Nylanderia fulva TaxID=613905 RepID=UPI0010FAE193|nr:elongation of very long chain fatty acids protein AAEL008004-like [Nylanderia fulva]
MMIIFGYLYFIRYIGPRYMISRTPYKLKTLMLLYNFIQILANLWMVQEFISSDWFSKYTLLCSELFPHSSNTLKIFNSMWWLFILKIFDLTETCIFVLRKKQNQVSTLHVYHHVSNIFFGWFYLKYILDERVLLLTLFNCSIHVIMYMYYFVSAWGPKYQQKIYFLKPFITKIQMVQFVAIIILGLQILNPACPIQEKFHSVVAAFFIGNILILLYLFYDFYKKSYTDKPKKKE